MEGQKTIWEVSHLPQETLFSMFLQGQVKITKEDIKKMKEIMIARWGEEKYKQIQTSMADFFDKYNITPKQYMEIICSRGIREIQIGDKFKCLNCGKEIILNNKTYIFDSEVEYIKCPHCKKTYDVQYYHLYGEKVKE